LDTVLLGLISAESQEGLHGYAIMVAVNKSFSIRLTPSTLYPELKALESWGLLKSFWGISDKRPSKKYKITEKGEELLHQYSTELQMFVSNSVLP